MIDESEAATATNQAKDDESRSRMRSLAPLYERPLSATRTGALYGAFSYPTKISPETIALFIASHTQPGDTVLDVFGGSGTTGLAALLCSDPPDELRTTAERLGLPVVWGPRSAYIYELGALGAFVGRTLCHPPDADRFLHQALRWIATCEQRIGEVYAALDDRGEPGAVRHAIWTEYLICPYCWDEVSFWNAAVRLEPSVGILSQVTCPHCARGFATDEAPRVTEEVWDPLLQRPVVQRKRRIARIYGRTAKRTWSRPPTAIDEATYDAAMQYSIPRSIPRRRINWGDLHRAGYHFGISHVHHLYTRRNLLVMGTLWDAIAEYPADLRDALQILALSFNATHSTLMTRVVVKQGQRDFVLTGAQSGVLYVSGLPVEKNIFQGLRRKATTFAKAFAVIGRRAGHVEVVNASSTKLMLPDNSVDYVFTDPPFGDFIPYSEVNFLNEAWLNTMTDTSEEVIISAAQGKGTSAYGALMAKVFGEIARVLKPHGHATVVFHAARAEVWETLRRAYSQAGLAVELSSVLNKLQGSFKQVTSVVSVQGDPLLLLSKGASDPVQILHELDPTLVLDRLFEAAARSGDPQELSVERLYSRFVGHYLKHGARVPLDASDFYPIAQARRSRS